MRNESFWRRIYQYFVDHWILTTFFSTVPVWYFTLVKLLGKPFGWVDNNGVYAQWVYWLLIFFFASSFIFDILLSLSIRYDNKAKRYGQDLYSIVLDSLNSIKLAKVSRFVKYIDQHGGRSGLLPFDKITQPREQIESILLNFQSALSRISRVRQDDISLSIIYKFGMSNKWDWLAKLNNEGDLELDELISNPQATIHEIVEGKQTEIFFPNKSIGLNANQYVDCKRDVSSHGRGSILCKDIGLTTKKKYVSAILSISTYGLQICSENDNDAIKLLLETILPAYVKRIQLELTLLYIKEIMAVPSKKPRVNRNS